MKLAIPNIFILTYRLFLPVNFLFLAIASLFLGFYEYKIKWFISFIIIFPISIYGLLSFKKIKFLWVDKKGMYWIYLFSFKKDQILWDQPHRVNYSLKSAHKSRVYREVKIKSKENVEVIFTDYDFYNFNDLTSHVKNGKNQRNKINLEYVTQTKSYHLIKCIFQVAFLLLYFSITYQYIYQKTYFVIPIYFILLIIDSFYEVIWCYITNKTE